MWITREVGATAEAAWDLLVDVRRWPEWGPSVRDAVLDCDDRERNDRRSWKAVVSAVSALEATDASRYADRPWRLSQGSTGRVRPALGPWVAFRVTTFEEGRSWGWRVAGVPATTHRVESLGQERCRVGFEVPTWAAPYAVVCATALRRIDHVLAT